MKKIFFVIPLLILAIALGVLAFFLLIPAGSDKKREVVVVSSGTKDENLSQRLLDQKLITSSWAFTIARYFKGKNGKIQPGGYYVNQNMNTLQIVDVLTGEPELRWVVIPEGLRKEEIGERLQDALGWNEEELTKWNELYTTTKFDYLEGVYFPDTYLIPVKENGLDIANRMTNRFNEKFAPYINQFAKKDIIWTTGIRLASIIQREAAGKEDMPLISGILWNRLLQDQRLEIDATVQYARGKTEKGWWAPVTPNDIKTIDSPYNTYKYKGLPPHPITNPGLAAIEAALNPQETECLFYLHDNNRQIHCAKTFKEHNDNIKKYLRHE